MLRMTGRRMYSRCRKERDPSPDEDAIACGMDTYSAFNVRLNPSSFAQFQMKTPSLWLPPLQGYRAPESTLLENSYSSMVH